MTRALRSRVTALEVRRGMAAGGVVAKVLDCCSDVSPAERDATLRRWGHLTLEQFVLLSLASEAEAEALLQRWLH